ncbi:MAG: hypothetical protein M1365_05260 [Actinobacteria bacterium]|nr:hypothetical protein [Actinomycetota bacterium]
MNSQAQKRDKQQGYDGWLAFTSWNYPAGTLFILIEQYILITRNELSTNGH